jgi:hypothetical protein
MAPKAARCIMKYATAMERLVDGLRRRGVLLDGAHVAAGELCDLSWVELPRLFRDLVREHRFIAFEAGEIVFHSNIRGKENDFDSLLGDKMLTTSLLKAGFSPVGRPATGSYDRVCFDMRHHRRPMDAPLVRLRHEAILSRNQMPCPIVLAPGIFDLIDA